MRADHRFAAHGASGISSQHHLAALAFTHARPMDKATAITITVKRARRAQASAASRGAIRTSRRRP